MQISRIGYRPIVINQKLLSATLHSLNFLQRTVISYYYITAECHIKAQNSYKLTFTNAVCEYSVYVNILYKPERDLIYSLQ